MLVSGSILKSAIERYNNKKKTIERYSGGQSASAGVSAAFDSFVLVVAMVFFVLELIVLYFAVSVAIKCTRGGPERIVHIVMANTFTLPYMLLNTLFNDCAKKTLRGDA